ncbi:hypothetical protein D9Q98_005086 [Chlorella vulgaris]|uniref:Wax synthase domain-containing protein n=1 Tax=Chlorella vulgaris TaxID=3077 RepID=A0A9D4TNS3_CHLVU|nr:hypothetical protein D9Q98_005086 [Chlorella vulgaris]
MLPLVARGLLCVALALAAAAYLWQHRHVPPGWGRIVVTLPVLAVLQLPPLLFTPDEPWPIFFSMNFPWLSVTSVIEWAVGSQAAMPHFLAFAAFLFCPALPVRPPSEQPYRARPHKRQSFGLFNAVVKVVGLAASVVAFDCLSEPRWLLGILQAVSLIWFTSLALDCAAAVASVISGMDVLEPFDRPYLSASISEFWGRRWNRVAGTKFRTSVYEPICYGMPAAVGQTQQQAQQPGQVQPGHASSGPSHSRPSVAPWRRILAMCTTFAVSGAVHELAFYHLTRRLSGHWMLFFTMQGPLLLVEAWLRQLCRQAGIRLPLVVRIVCATTVLHWCAQLLFFPDLVAAGVPRMLLHQLLPGGICSGPASGTAVAAVAQPAATSECRKVFVGAKPCSTRTAAAFNASSLRIEPSTAGEPTWCTGL